ncbi:hypothetical protein A3Q56_08661 [Intoshia linei]|uniref:Uncharacterized protein n=1 Tax=Intoshia linei TaxID=1819745 RepID=A0A177ANI3_9BILA|nr:hypothetical protein A3Q56_08661 [Intoshia linei]
MKNSHLISDFNNLSLDELDKKYFERKQQLEFDQECKLQEEYRKEGIIVESIRYLNNWINVDDTSYVICTSVIAEFILLSS